MLWNIEGFERNAHNIAAIVESEQPDFIFLSEPQIYNCDIDLAMSYIAGSYSYYLNSEDKFNPDLPFLKSKAHGGTLVLWKHFLTPFITIHPPPSSAILPLIVQLPRCSTTIHITLYLPTHGKDNAFVDEITNLSSLLNELSELYPNAPAFIRGDFNVSDKNLRRKRLLDYFKEDKNICEILITHPTYHHFMGEGVSDSRLDKILVSNGHEHTEQVDSITCALINPLVASLHDIIWSSWQPTEENEIEVSSTFKAPRKVNDRHRVVWSDYGIVKYQQLIIPHLLRLQNLWLASPTKSSLALLLQSTNNVLTMCAKGTNKIISLCKINPAKSRRVPHKIRKSARILANLARNLRKMKLTGLHDSETVKNASAHYRYQRSQHRKLCRSIRAREAFNRDHKLMNSPSATFTFIRASKRCRMGNLNKLHVGQETFVGDNVPDGFYSAIKTLKTKDKISLKKSPYYDGFVKDYRNILELSKNSEPIPPITEVQSTEILHKLKPGVSDFFNITPNHYLYAGPAGCRHFHLLLSSLINDVNATTINEVNSVYS